MARRGTSANVKTTTAEDLAAKCVRITDHRYTRSRMIGWQRWAANMANWDAYHHRMDWSHKKPWQTMQTLPDFGVTIEQTVGAFERALSDTDDWLAVDAIGIGDPLLDPDTIQHLLLYYLNRLYTPGDVPETFYGMGALTGDSLKMAMLESILTWKIYAVSATKTQYRLEPAEPVVGPHGHPEHLPSHDLTPHGPPKVQKLETSDFRLAIDLIPYEDWYPDRSPQRVMDIHEVTRNFTELLANPDYDPAAVQRLMGSANSSLSDAYRRRRENVPFVQHESWEIRVRECWGDLIDPTTGDVLATNSFWTVAGGQVLRPPTPNPFWHGKRPFVSTALTPTPKSQVHRALADASVSLWRFMNEQISLLMDGGLSSVWGVHQVRPDLLEYPDEISEGIPQAAALTLKPNTPEGMKAVERIDSGEVPQYGIEMFNMTQREYQVAMLTNDLAMGQLPSRQVKATEIVESMSAKGSLLESMAARVETRHYDPAFELAWQVILQYEDDLVEPELIQLLGPERTMALMQHTPEERFVLLAQAAKFRVRGLRGVASKNRTLTKLANLLQLRGQDPSFAQAFDAEYSMRRISEVMVRCSGVDPTTIKKTPQELQQEQQQQDQLQAQQILQETMAGGPAAGPVAGGGPGPVGPPGGSPPALVNAAQDQQGAESGMAPQQPMRVPMGAMGGV